MYTLIGLTVISIFWCLPQGLMSAELSLMTKANGGGVIWVVLSISHLTSHRFNEHLETL